MLITDYDKIVKHRNTPMFVLAGPGSGKTHLLGDRIDIRVEQGYEIGRPSLLYLRAEDKEEQIDVSVGGKVVMVAKGELI